jgi:hypothetical protein
MTKTRSTALWAPIALLFALSGCDSGAGDDLARGPRGFFPLAVGNEWHTLGTHERTGEPTVTERVRYVVVGEDAPARFRVQLPIPVP